jgi:3-isopropylmalate/(R)-2-methylmalate dehydratase small subunit
MKPIIRGLAWVTGDAIDTDQIIPAQHLVYSMDEPEERRLYGRYASVAEYRYHRTIPAGANGDLPIQNRRIALRKM